jgi:hypothetical protein
LIANASIALSRGAIPGKAETWFRIATEALEEQWDFRFRGNGGLSL